MPIWNHLGTAWSVVVKNAIPYVLPFRHFVLGKDAINHAWPTPRLLINALLCTNGNIICARRSFAVSDA